MSELATQIEAFKQNIINSGYVLDPEGTHHEFVSGMHGQKLDFDKIERYSPLYEEWTLLAADYIQAEFPRLPEIIMGVANGTNRLAVDTATRRFVDERGEEIVGLWSAKDETNSKRLYLGNIATDAVKEREPELAVVLEDVGTTGSNSVQVALATLEAGAKRVEVVTTWKRRERLEKLEEAGVPYRAIIDQPLTTYTPEECRHHGFCSQGWEFIPRDK